MPTDLGDWATLGGAVFTAITAAAALATARQGRRMIEAAEAPFVDVQVMADADRDGMLRLSLVNAGRGVARGVSFWAYADGGQAGGVVGDGFLPPGHGVHVLTMIGPVPTSAGASRDGSADLAVMVTYRDAPGFVHYRAHDGREQVPRTRLRRRPRYPNRDKVINDLFPHVDVDRAVPVQYAVVNRP